jgi:hypothetical protein
VRESGHVSRATEGESQAPHHRHPRGGPTAPVEEGCSGRKQVSQSAGQPVSGRAQWEKEGSSVSSMLHLNRDRARPGGANMTLAAWGRQKRVVVDR